MYCAAGAFGPILNYMHRYLRQFVPGLEFQPPLMQPARCRLTELGAFRPRAIGRAWSATTLVGRTGSKDRASDRETRTGAVPRWEGWRARRLAAGHAG